MNNAFKRGTFVKPIDDIEAQFTPMKNALANVEEADADSVTENSFTKVHDDEEILFTSDEIYHGFTSGDWDTIGWATEDRETMIARVQALLEHHLELLIREHQPGSKLSLSVKVQLTRFVKAVAETYGDPNFHRLSHALHVATSMDKLLSISIESGNGKSALDNFSLVFAAFLHDAGHTGELISEQIAIIHS